MNKLILEVVEYLLDSDINNITIGDGWIRIKYTHSPYLLSVDKDMLNATGFDVIKGINNTLVILLEGFDND